uniref:Uncharacterized protein n=1 Tax=Acrobeloides nanus TaxID=290746 RepID=A0A914EG01_9BILA
LIDQNQKCKMDPNGLPINNYDVERIALVVCVAYPRLVDFLKKSGETNAAILALLSANVVNSNRANQNPEAVVQGGVNRSGLPGSIEAFKS